MTKKQFINKYLADKKLYGTLGKKESDRSDAFLKDERLAKSFIWQEAKDVLWREKNAVKITYTKGFEGLHSVMIPVEKKPLISELSHWTGPYGPAVPLPSWRQGDLSTTVRILGRREFSSLSTRR